MSRRGGDLDDVGVGGDPDERPAVRPVQADVTQTARVVGLEVGADEVLMAKSGVDGVYTADPKKDPGAQKYEHLTYDEALLNDIRVMDQTAMTMCKDNGLSMMVFGMEGDGNVTRALLGDRIGTTVTV